MNNTIKAISYEEYVNTPSLRNSYNAWYTGKVSSFNYGCIFVETILGVTDVMEIEEVEYLDDVIKSEIINNQGYILKELTVLLYESIELLEKYERRSG